MSEFCKQCSIDIFGEDFRELAGLLSEKDKANGCKYVQVLCEDCGLIQVNDGGECVSEDCYKKGHK